MSTFKLFSIGHSNHPFERFLELLRQHEIAALADIRRFPGSRKHPHFNSEALRAALVENGIEYQWIESLGGRRKKAAADEPSINLGLRNESFRNYADYMATDEFAAGIATLAAMAEKVPTAMMCAEGLWWQCHRRLVSDFLEANGATVMHMMPNGQLKPHAMTPGSQSRRGQVIYPGERTLFDNEMES